MKPPYDIPHRDAPELAKQVQRRYGVRSTGVGAQHEFGLQNRGFRGLSRLRIHSNHEQLPRTRLCDLHRKGKQESELKLQLCPCDLTTLIESQPAPIFTIQAVRNFALEGASVRMTIVPSVPASPVMCTYTHR